MSRFSARNPRDAVVPATVPAKVLASLLTPPRPLLAALVITAAGLAAAQPALARSAPHQPREGFAAVRAPGPGDGGGGQVIAGARAGGGQGRSGAGKSNQNLNGVVSPTFVRGQSQQALTDFGSFDVQAGFCAVNPNTCLIGQTLPVRYRT